MDTPRNHEFNGRYCFDIELFSKETFHTGKFLEECRSRHSMEVVHKDLTAFRTSLENQVKERDLFLICSCCILTLKHLSIQILVGSYY
jgi:hypothetical protein